MELIKDLKLKMFYSVKEVACLLDTDTETIKDLIDNGDLSVVGSEKNLIKLVDLKKFMYGEEVFTKEVNRPIDFLGEQRYLPIHSIKIENITEEDWESMQKNGIKESKPYWNETRKKWCLALSLGYDENHKRIRKVITANNQEELWSKYGEFKAKNMILPAEDSVGMNTSMVNKIRNPKADMLFKDYFEEYLKSLPGGGISGKGMTTRTQNGYANLSYHIINGLGDYKMCEIDKSKIKTFINELVMKKYTKGNKTSYYSQSVINKVFDLLHGAIKNASDEDGDQILPVDFMKNIKKPRSMKIKNSEVQALTDDDIEKIIKGIKSNKMVYTWILLLLYLGVRPGEALALRFKDINYKRKEISINQALSYDLVDGHKKPVIKNLKNLNSSNKTNYQKRTLKISKKVIAVLKEWEDQVKNNQHLMMKKKENGTEDLLFCGSAGQLWLYDDYKQVYERLLKKNGMSISEYNPYRFRHNLCTRMLRVRKDIKTVQLIMGDNTADMIIKVYANMNKDDILKGSSEYSIGMDNILGDII